MSDAARSGTAAPAQIGQSWQAMCAPLWWLHPACVISEAVMCIAVGASACALVGIMAPKQAMSANTISKDIRRRTMRTCRTTGAGLKWN